uniref:Small ribosomal subunit protein uS7 n=1 Tax=Eptatretus burgeri TaxID=7764 RepID=A0A8C4QAZ1_EPTBU
MEEAPLPEIEPEVAPVLAEAPEIKLFGRWSTEDVQISDISLQDYIAVKEKYAKYLPHSAGRYAAKRFRKAQCPIVERLCNSMMMHGRNNGKKLMTVRIVKHAFEIIHLLTGENPLQVLVNAIINSGPREDSTRIGRAGTVRRQAVDVSPLRRVNQAIWLLCTGAREAAFHRSPHVSIAHCFFPSFSHPCLLLPLLYVVCIGSHTSLNSVYKKRNKKKKSRITLNSHFLLPLGSRHISVTGLALRSHV